MVKLFFTGAKTAASRSTNRDRQGKVAELQQLAEAHEADLVIFNHELTPRQSQLIGDALEVGSD